MAENTEETGEATEPATQENTASGQPQPETDSGGKDPHKAILADLARERRERKRIAQELADEKAKGLSEAERAIADAKAEGRQEAAAEAGKKLARAELKAAAAGAGADASKVSKALDYLDMSRFVGDDGEPNPTAIADWVKTLPEPSARPRGNADQGVRGSGGLPQSDGEVFADLLQRQLNPK